MRVKILALTLLMTASLISCGKNTSITSSNMIYNSSINNSFVDGPNYIFGNVINQNNTNSTIIIDKSSGKVEPFIRDPFYSEKKSNTYIDQIQIDSNKNNGFYMANNISDNEAGFSIMQFDLNTFAKKEIYSKNNSLGKPVFLGLNQVSNIVVSKENDFSDKKTSNIDNITRTPTYFININDLYIKRDDGILRINLKTKKEDLIINEYDIKSISCDGEYIYYINNTYDLYRYSLKTSKSNKLISDKSTYLIVEDKNLIYTNLNDKNKIYIMNKDGTDNHKIGDSSAKNLNYDDKYIYYSNNNDNQRLYRIKYDGSDNQKMTNVPAYFVFTFKDYDYVYIWSDDEASNGIKNFSVNKKNFHTELLKF